MKKLLSKTVTIAVTLIALLAINGCANRTFDMRSKNEITLYGAGKKTSEEIAQLEEASNKKSNDFVYSIFEGDYLLAFSSTVIAPNSRRSVFKDNYSRNIINQCGWYTGIEEPSQSEMVVGKIWEGPYGYATIRNIKFSIGFGQNRDRPALVFYTNTYKFTSLAEKHPDRAAQCLNLIIGYALLKKNSSNPSSALTSIALVNHRTMYDEIVNHGYAVKAKADAIKAKEQAIAAAIAAKEKAKVDAAAAEAKAKVDAAALEAKKKMEAAKAKAKVKINNAKVKAEVKVKAAEKSNPTVSNKTTFIAQPDGKKIEEPPVFKPNVLNGLAIPKNSKL